MEFEIKLNKKKFKRFQNESKLKYVFIYELVCWNFRKDNLILFKKFVKIKKKKNYIKAKTN